MSTYYVVMWHQGGMGDAEYLAAFQQVVMPVAYEVCACCVLYANDLY